MINIGCHEILKDSWSCSCSSGVDIKSLAKKNNGRSLLIMQLIEFIDTFREFLIKLLKAFLSISIVYLPIILCATKCTDKMRFNAYKSETRPRRGKIIARSRWWSAKNIDYRDNAAKHFHSAPNKRSFCFHFSLRLFSRSPIVASRAFLLVIKRAANNEYEKN